MPKLRVIDPARPHARELAAAVREYEAKGQNIETERLQQKTVREGKRMRYFPWPLFLNLSVIWPEKGEIERKLYG